MHEENVGEIYRFLYTGLVYISNFRNKTFKNFYIYIKLTYISKDEIQ